MAGVASGLSVKAWNNKLAKYMREKEHKAKQRTGSKLHHTYGKASRSLEDATEYIDDYAKALKLKGIGDFVAKELEKYIRTDMMSGGGGGGGADDGDGAGGGGAGGDGGGGSGANTVSSGTGSRAKKGGWKGRAKGGGTGSAAAAASAALAASTSASTSQETKKVWDLLGAVHFSQSQSQTQASSAAAASLPSQPSRRELCAAAALKRAGPVPGFGGEEKENRGGAWGEAGGKGGGGGAGSSDEDEAAMIVISDDEEDSAGDRNRKLPPLAPPMAVIRVPIAASAASASSSHRGGGASPSSSSTSSGAGRKRKAPSGVDPSASASASSQPPPPPLPEPGTLAANGLGSMGIFVPSPLAVGAEEEEAEEGEGPPCLDHLFNHFGKAGEDWTVVLLLDCREHSNNKQVQSRLHQARIPCDLAALNLGDMTWVARRQRQQPGPQSLMEAAAAAAAAATSAGGKKRVGAAAAAQREEAARGEVMLRYLVERKTSADLAASIKDGRYKEQKGRMRGAGNEVDRAFYLIEGALHHQDSGMPATTLRTALANTQVLHGLPVLATDNLDQTIALLARMHRRIEGAFAHFLRAARAGPGSVQRREYLASRLPSLPLPPARVIPFAEYQARCKKSGGERGLDVAAMFARQLRQVPNLGKKQIEAIVAAYPTSASLAGALKGLPKEEALAMLRSLPLPASGRSLGPKSAEMLWLVYK